MDQLVHEVDPNQEIRDLDVLDKSEEKVNLVLKIADITNPYRSEPQHVKLNVTDLSCERKFARAENQFGCKTGP